MAKDPSEVPPTMHELAEQQVKQAHAAYDQITAYVSSAMSAWMGTIPSNPMTAGLKDAQDRAIEIAKSNADSAFTLAGEIANAKIPQDVFSLQTHFAQDRMQALPPWLGFPKRSEKMSAKSE